MHRLTFIHFYKKKNVTTFLNLFFEGHCDLDWGKLHRFFEKFPPLVIMGAKLRALLKPLGTIYNRDA